MANFGQRLKKITFFSLLSILLFVIFSFFFILHLNTLLSREEEKGTKLTKKFIPSSSSFRSQLYKCTGKCYCNDGGDQRRGIGALTVGSRSLVFLVAAISTIKALGIAKQHFEEECEELLNSENVEGLQCPNIAIRSEIEDCVLKSEEEEEISSTKTDASDQNEIIRKTFECSGKCLTVRYFYNDKIHVLGVPYDEDEPPRETLIKQFQIMQKEADDFQCPLYELKKEYVTIEIERKILIKELKKMIPRYNIKKFGPGTAEWNGLEEFFAYKKFIDEVLEKFCISDSLRDFNQDLVADNYYFKTLKENTGNPQFPLCCSNYENINPTVKCHEVKTENLY